MSGDTITKKRNDSLYLPCFTKDISKWRKAKRQSTFATLEDWAIHVLNAAAKAQTDEPTN